MRLALAASAAAVNGLTSCCADQPSLCSWAAGRGCERRTGNECVPLMPAHAWGVGFACSQANWKCQPGELVAGLHVAWEPAPVPPYTNIATGIRIYCENPNACGPPVASTPPPPPRPVPPSPPVADPGWSTWIGRPTPQSTIGVCPCGGYIQVRACRRLLVGAVPALHCLSAVAAVASAPLSLLTVLSCCCRPGMPGTCQRSSGTQMVSRRTPTTSAPSAG